MKIKLFIDFDGTLFDTGRFREAFFDILFGQGFSKTELLPYYQEECRDYKFSLNVLLEKLHKVKHFDLGEARERIDKLYPSIPTRFLYSDVERLGEINKEIFEPILISLGDPYFQQRKAESSGLLKYFDEAYFTELQKWEYLKKIVSADEIFYIIDDRRDTIHHIASEFPNAIAIEIDRRSHDTSDPVTHVPRYKNLRASNLTRALKILESDARIT